MADYEPMAQMRRNAAIQRQPGQRAHPSGDVRRPGSRPPQPAVLPWISFLVFAAVGAAIVYELIQSLRDGRHFAAVLEVVFGLLWMFVTLAYWQDVKKRARPRA